MLIGEPAPTGADLHFRIGNVPVRVHPFFWVAGVLLGLRGGESGTPPAELLIWLIAFVFSFLLHEMGHALMQRHFGGHPRITLYAMGGLAHCDDCDRSSLAQILISLAGPGAGFFVALILVALLLATGHPVGWSWSTPVAVGFAAPPDGLSFLGATLYWARPTSDAAALLIRNLFWLNIFWGLVNLLPVYPLDGGHVAREVLQIQAGPRRGLLLSLQLSAAAGAAMALYGLTLQSLLIALFFGYLAYQSYRTWTAYRSHFQ